MATALIIAASVETAAAQDLGCTMSDSTAGPPRQILHCRSGVTVEAEAAADVQLLDRAGNGRPDGVDVNAGAVLVDVPAGYPGGFQILTPRAIAGVRGTSWVIDVGADATSVFVIRGRVDVSRIGSGQAVSLSKGKGVDVDASTTPLRVKRWKPQRATALLARFGR